MSGLGEIPRGITPGELEALDADYRARMGDPPDAVETAESLTPDEWQRRKGIRILDPDGWRGHGGRPWDDAITEAEFDRRAAPSTQSRWDWEAGRPIARGPSLRTWMATGGNADAPNTGPLAHHLPGCCPTPDPTITGTVLGETTLTNWQEYKIEDACHTLLTHNPSPAADEIGEAVAPVVTSLLFAAREEAAAARTAEIVAGLRELDLDHNEARVAADWIEWVWRS